MELAAKFMMAIWLLELPIIWWAARRRDKREAKFWGGRQ